MTVVDYNSGGPIRELTYEKPGRTTMPSRDRTVVYTPGYDWHLTFTCNGAYVGRELIRGTEIVEHEDA